MSFPRYSKYKDSGVDWLGDVPEHWGVKRLKYLGEAITGLTYNPSDIVDEGNGTLVLRSSNVQGRKIVFDDNVYVSTPIPADLVTKAGDILICSRNGSRALIGKNAMIGEESAGQTFGAFMTVFRSQHSRYLSCVLNSPLFQFQSAAFLTSTINQLTIGVLNNFEVPLPPENERQQIATFLDQETGKIDALVAEQERLLVLLKEKRQAVISHAVTKGLNPQAPLKPSGIEWLGAVPAHWMMRKLSHLFRAGKGKNGQLLTKEYCAENEGDYPVYSGQTENEGIMGTWNQFEFDFGERGVLFSTTVGAKAMNLRQLFGRFSLSQNCMIIWATSEFCLTRFYYYHFQPLFQYQRSMIPEHMQPSFRMEDLYGYAICLPPREEQSAIVEYLDDELPKFDDLTNEAQRAIDLLQERRTALISAAVTGQIDVRGVAHAKPENHLVGTDEMVPRPRNLSPHEPRNHTL